MSVLYGNMVHREFEGEDAAVISEDDRRNVSPATQLDQGAVVLCRWVYDAWHEKSNIV